ncbi:MAG: type IV pilin N-terminal domain-containing protein [Halococcoides sp.]
MYVPHPFEADRAAGKPIGVIMLATLTLIVALAGATFVLGPSGASVASATPAPAPGPSASFAMDWDGGPDTAGPVTITHTGGEAVPAARLEIRGTVSDTPIDWTGTDPVEYGDTMVVESVGPTDQLRLVWVPPDGGPTRTLASWTGPQA